MTQIVGVSALDFAYKGYQYPLPPSWKYAVRIQDQINWLLQAVLALDTEGVSEDDLRQGIDDAVAMFRAQIAPLQDEIRQIEDYNAVFRNPVTGMRDYGYVVAKQMYDMLRTYACTWDELRDTGMTWNALKATGHSWFEVDMFGNIYWGDGEQRAKFTPADHVDVGSPGYTLCVPGTGDGGESEPTRKGTTWNDILYNGFLMET